jgi:hypothetical protein
MTVRRIQGIIGIFLGVEEVLRRRMSFPLARTLRTSMAIGRGVQVFVNGLIGGKQGEKEIRS